MTSPQTNGNGNRGNGGGKRTGARWPDLLIGLLVLLLLGGFGVLLLGQRSPTVANTATTPPSTAPVPPATTPADNTEIPAAPGTAATAPPELEPTPVVPAPAAASPEPQAATPTPAPTPAAAPEQPGASTAAVTPTPSTPAATAPPTTPAAAASATPTEPTTSLNDIPTIVAAPVEPVPAEQPATPAAPSASATPARTGGAVATSETRTPLRSDYRISLGTFSSESAAGSSTAGVSGLGYRVYPIDVGSGVVAQIGPFADEATARQALADVQRAYPNAILYPPRNRSLTGGTVSGNNPVAPSSRAPSETATPSAPVAPATPEPQTAAPAPTGPVYLQVGAFDRVESAQNLVGTLREQGFAPTVNAPEGRKVTVLVGPFSGDALTRAEERLTSSGLDSFRVR